MTVPSGSGSDRNDVLDVAVIGAGFSVLAALLELQLEASQHVDRGVANSLYTASGRNVPYGP